MDTLAMSALESAEEWAARLSQEQLECRSWGHQFPRERKKRKAEALSDGGLRWYFKCRGCKLPMVYTYYPQDHTYTSVYDYSGDRFKNYGRKGRGHLTRQQRGAIREMAMEL